MKYTRAILQCNWCDHPYMKTRVANFPLHLVTSQCRLLEVAMGKVTLSSCRLPLDGGAVRWRLN